MATVKGKQKGRLTADEVINETMCDSDSELSEITDDELDLVCNSNTNNDLHGMHGINNAVEMMTWVVLVVVMEKGNKLVFYQKNFICILLMVFDNINISNLY